MRSGGWIFGFSMLIPLEVLALYLGQRSRQSDTCTVDIISGLLALKMFVCMSEGPAGGFSEKRFGNEKENLSAMYSALPRQIPQC